MRIRIMAVGSKMPAWVVTATQDYLKRFPREWHVEFVDIALAYRGKGQAVSKVIAKEGEKMLALIDPREHVIALDVKGKSWSTEQLSAQMTAWQINSGYVALLIGGPDGLAPECSARADQHWSLSALTLPHPLVRVVLAEQLYRGWTIIKNHPYHRNS